MYKILNTETKTFTELKELPKKHYGESMTDKSHFRPNVSKLNDVIGTVKEIDESMYHFKNGKDTGDRFYDLINPSLDVAERQENYEKLKANADFDKENLSEMMKAEMEEMHKNAEEMNKNTVSETSTQG